MRFHLIFCYDVTSYLILLWKSDRIVCAYIYQCDCIEPGVYSPKVQGVQRTPFNLAGQTRHLQSTKMFAFFYFSMRSLFLLNNKLLFLTQTLGDIVEYRYQQISLNTNEPDHFHCIVSNTTEIAFFSLHAIQMQDVFNFKTEPRCNVTMHVQSHH